MRWSGGADNRGLLALAAAVAAMPAAGLLRTGPTWASLVVVVLVAALTLTGAAALASVRVTFGPNGLRVGAGPWGWPARSVSSAEILGARVEFRDPATLGAWGYHERPGHTVVMVRAGECLVLDLTGERSLAVAVDGAAAAAAVIDASLAGPVVREGEIAHWGGV
ncbi:MAG TPA: hypothetical protein VGO86_12980 [Candidatus Dormibacteraeota bacterium]|jgi:hypothetical protein